MVVNLVILPLTFISSIWFPTDGMPKALSRLAKIFPIRALADGLQYAFDPRHDGAGFNGQDVRTLAIWTVVGIFLMVRFLRQPQGEVAMSTWLAATTRRRRLRPAVPRGR